jgi:hypothetical protein
MDFFQITGFQHNLSHLDSNNDLRNLGVSQLKELISAKLANIAKLEKGRAKETELLNSGNKSEEIKKTFSNRISEATNYIKADKDALPQLYDALTYSYIKQCNDDNPEKQKEAFAEIVRLVLTNCGIGDNIVSEMFEVSKVYSLEKLIGLVSEDNFDKRHTESHQQICLQLAKEHHGIVTNIELEAKKNASWLSGTSAAMLKEKFDGLSQGKYPYHEILAVGLYTLASLFGSAEASFELAKIYMADQFALPQNQIRTNQQVAIVYAVTAIQQGDKDALYKLAALHKTQPNLINAQLCFEKAIEIDAPMAYFKRAQLFYDNRQTKHAYENCFDEMMNSNDPKMMNDYANWIETRNTFPSELRKNEATKLRQKAAEMLSK